MSRREVDRIMEPIFDEVLGISTYEIIPPSETDKQYVWTPDLEHYGDDFNEGDVFVCQGQSVDHVIHNMVGMGEKVKYSELFYPELENFDDDEHLDIMLHICEEEPTKLRDMIVKWVEKRRSEIVLWTGVPYEHTGYHSKD